MIWLTWRQHRKQAHFIGIALAALAALIVPSGLAMRRTFDDLGLPACLRTLGTGQFVPDTYSQACNEVGQQFEIQYRMIGSLSVLFVFLPILVGLFLGAPLIAREVEHGTHRVVWTQGISRRQWAVAKIGLVGSASLIVAAIYGFGVSWWLAPLYANGQPRLDVFNFDVGGVAPMAYTLFAVALGIVAGTIWRKMLPAMAAVLVGFVTVRIAVAAFARPNYRAPISLEFPVEGPNPGLNSVNGDWVQLLQIRDGAGAVIMDNASTLCAPGSSDCGAITGYVNFTQYQPGSRFWLFQSIESGIYVALAAVLIAIAMRQLKRIA